MTIREIIEALPLAAQEASSQELPALLGRIVEAEAMLRLRMVSATANAPNTAPATNAESAEQRSPRYLNVDEALARLGGKLCRKTLYRRTKGRSFRVNLSRKAVRFEERGFMRWIEAGCC
jgi:hypothetical protein